MARRKANTTKFVKYDDLKRDRARDELTGKRHAAASAPPQQTQREQWLEEEALDFETNERGGSCCDQLLATLRRTMQQKMRSKISFLLELLIPLVFVTATIILWKAFGDEKFDAASVLNYSKAGLRVAPNNYQSLVCNNNSAVPIGDLAVCGEPFFPNVTCDGDETWVPVKGLCVRKEVGGGEGLTGTYINAMAGNLAVLPTFDDLILHQWVARKFMGDSSADLTLSASGLAANNRLNSIVSSGFVYFAPAANIPAGLIETLNTTTLFFENVYGGVFDTLEEAQAHVIETDSPTWCVIEFRSPMAADIFDVIIYMNDTALPPLDLTVDIMYPGGFQFDRGEMYLASGFSTWQRFLYDYYLSKFHNTTTEGQGIYFASFGSNGYRRKVLLETASSLVSFIIVLSFLYPVSQLAQQIVLEKELRIREAMLIMGMNNSSLYISWFFVYALQYMLQCILIVIMLKATYMISTDALLLFAIVYLFALTTIPLSGLIASFFSKARLVSMLAPLIFFILSVPIFAFTSANEEVVIGVSLLSPTGLAALLTNIIIKETSVGFSTIDVTSHELAPRSCVLIIVLAIDFVLYYILMLYFDAVLPKDWGSTKHPLFFIIDPFKACCCCCDDKELDQGSNEDGRAPDGVFEDVDDDDAAVRIVGLRKVYKRGGKEFTAVNNLYWGLRFGEISVLLGHNGAGKSTAMNMMTGMVEPNQGDCYINGYSVRNDLSRVRQQLGFCPQHNILWPDLTCRDHLEFYGMIKGLRGAELENAVRTMLAEVDLLDKMDLPAGSLSGGMKRKLSVAVAFVGRSAITLLDEPTAGMDVSARRYTWDLLRRMSEVHTILLTTHYMDEADLLGHRIGIMSKGSLQCSGSSIFLKSRLGVGYNMSISVAPDADAEEIDALVLSLVASAEASSFNGVDIIYKLPMEDVDQFPTLLAGLEEDGEAAGVRGFSLSATTLEEVFLQIAVEDMYKEEASAAGDAKKPSEEELAEERSIVWNCELMTSAGSRSSAQFGAMMAKRFWNALRDRRMQCFQLVCPVVCILLAMLLTLIEFKKPTVTTEMSSAMFGEEVEMEVSGCYPFFGELDKETRQDNFVHDNNFMDGENMSFYTVDTAKTHTMPRFMSIMCNDPGIDAIVPTVSGPKHLLFYNSSAYHASGIAMNQMYNFILQKATGNTSRMLATSAKSMPDGTDGKTTRGGVQTILIGAIVMIPFTFLPSNPVAWVVKERECGARHMQDVTGLSFFIYWICNFFFDIVAYIISTGLVMIIFVIFNRKEYISPQSAGPTFVTFLVYGFCSTAAAYCVSFFFNEHSNAQTVVMAVSFVGGFLLVMMVFILSLVENTKDASDILRWIFRLLPSYCVGEAIINLSMVEQKKILGEMTSAWDMDVTLWPIIYMAIEFPVFLALTLFIDHPTRRMWGQASHYNRQGPAEVIDGEDSDIEDERKAIYDAEKNQVNEDIVRVVDLRKVYDSGKVAVRNLAFSILPDEVFGFLGTNGAGKTTTISMLCQEFVPTSGSAYVCGYDIVAQSREAIQCIGYCPQFDTTLDLLTCQEHLNLYAGIRGVLSEHRDAVVTGLMRMCGILEYRSTNAGDLSGGNRRKLSVAISLIGAPQIVFLDEPSAGMDPVARRGLWTAIQAVAQNCSVVLTTHHLEEIEALADTVGIMADGAMRCIGDKIHLKNKYGSGFEMHMRIADNDMRSSIERFVARSFPDAVLNEFKGQRFVYALPQETRLSETFRLLQKNQEKLGITDYSVSQTSIEQVFLRISEAQEQRTASGQRVINFTDSHATSNRYRESKAGQRSKMRDFEEVTGQEPRSDRRPSGEDKKRRRGRHSSPDPDADYDDDRVGDGYEDTSPRERSQNRGASNRNNGGSRQRENDEENAWGDDEEEDEEEWEYDEEEELEEEEDCDDAVKTKTNTSYNYNGGNGYDQDQVMPIMPEAVVPTPGYYPYQQQQPQEQQYQNQLPDTEQSALLAPVTEDDGHSQGSQWAAVRDQPRDRTFTESPSRMSRKASVRFVEAQPTLAGDYNGNNNGFAGPQGYGASAVPAYNTFGAGQPQQYYPPPQLPSTAGSQYEYQQLAANPNSSSYF